MLELLFQLGVFALLIGLGLFVGSTTERRHLRHLDQREKQTASMLVTQIKSFPSSIPPSAPPMLIVKEVVIATDYLKSFLAGLHNLFGGEVKSYQTLQTRARREATLRIVEEAKRSGYNAICNLRLDTADIGGGVGNRRIAMVAILASATAYQTAPRTSM